MPTRGTPIPYGGGGGMSLSGLPSVARLGVGKDSSPPPGGGRNACALSLLFSGPGGPNQLAFLAPFRVLGCVLSSPGSIAVLSRRSREKQVYAFLSGPGPETSAFRF